jgi:cysteine-rich repeat protein
MAHTLRARGAVSHAMPLAMPLTVLAMVLTIAMAPLASADCDSLQFGTRIGPPAMAQPDGNTQTVAGDCTGVPNCEDFFDIALEAGDTLSLSFCNDGGSASFDAELSIFETDLSWGSSCENYVCGNQAEASYVAGVTGIHRIRISHALGLSPVDGNYVLAYSAPAGRLITPVSCGNGVVDAGEQCDDGNQADGDCCSRGCTIDPVADTCADDGNSCTNDECDGAGNCTHPNRPAGVFCIGDPYFCTADTCDGAGTCVSTPVPGCAPLPACGLPLPPGNATFPHPQKAGKIEMPLVQAFVGCDTPDGNPSNATTETGTVPACFPAETYNEAAGSPSGGWHWGPYSKAKVLIFNRCKGAGDVAIKLSMNGITDGGGVLLSGDGTFALSTRLTLMDPVDGEMTAVDLPLSFGFTIVGGATKMVTSLNAMLAVGMLPPLPNGVIVELAPSPHGLLEIRDSNGNPFARPGIYLP